MNLDRWTTKSQEALQAAQRLAEEHLLKALSLSAGRDGLTFKSVAKKKESKTA